MGYSGDGLYQRNHSWYWESWIDGHRFRRLIGRNISKKVAREIAVKLRSEIVAGNYGFGKKVKHITFDEAREKFEAWAEANKKPQSVRSYKEALRRLNESFSGKTLNEISPFAVEGHRQRRVKAGVRVRVNRELAVLKNLYNRCREWKLYEGDNPVVTVKQTKEPKQRLRVLTPEEETRLLTECAEPLHTMILIGLYCGVRLKSEGLTLRWQDIDFRLKTLTVQAAYSKNSKPRTIPMNSLVLEALSRLPRKSEWVFTKPNGKPYTAVRGFIQARTTAGLIDVVPNTEKCAVTVHTLRHTFATRLIENGVDLRTVQELGGWSNLKMLERYGHVSPSRKAAAVEGLVPPNFPPSKIDNLVTA